MLVLEKYMYLSFSTRSIFTRGQVARHYGLYQTDNLCDSHACMSCRMGIVTYYTLQGVGFTTLIQSVYSYSSEPPALFDRRVHWLLVSYGYLGIKKTQSMSYFGLGLPSCCLVMCPPLVRLQRWKHYSRMYTYYILILFFASKIQRIGTIRDGGC